MRPSRTPPGHYRPGDHSLSRRHRERPRVYTYTAPKAGLALLGELDADDRMTHTHRLDAVRAHLLERAGDTVAARESYLRAARMTASAPEQRYLALRAARLHQPGPLATWRADPADMPARSPQIRLACRPGRLCLSVSGHTVGM